MTNCFALCLLVSCLCALSSAENDREKRAIRMLRMGKRGFGMLRLGRSAPYDQYESRQLFDVPRMGKDLVDIMEPSKRHPPIPRVGNLDKVIDEYRRMVADEATSFDELPRFGRFVRSAEEVANEVEGSHKEKREVSGGVLPRLGLRDVENEIRAAPLPRLGYRAIPRPRVGYRDLETLPRLGLRELEYQRAAPLPRLGLRENFADEDDKEERAVPLPRLGLRDLDKKAK
uniref:Myomodulin neuropeptide n=1 Tax=Platynereis dumerilii TaxID=6359 RepID=V5TCR4_PLADU|nr:myomodulin neuropeptide precursor [Platynereis dumerilii]